MIAKVVVGIALLLAVAYAHAAGPYWVVKCASGTPTPTNYVVAYNGGTPGNVAPHVGADQAVYLVLDAAAMPPPPAGSTVINASVIAENGRGRSGPKVYALDAGVPAIPGDGTWMATKP